MRTTVNRNFSSRKVNYSFDHEGRLLFCIALVFYCARSFSALYSINIINDCDESMNYWEPMHYIVYGVGLQTWEYSPLYGLRSYFYVGQYALISKIFSFFLSDKVELFYSIRVTLGAFHAAVDTLLFIVIRRMFGSLCAFLFLVFSALSPGNFISSTAFLPSSYAMMRLSFSLAMWLQNHEFFTIFGIAVATLIGWPFSVLVSVPFVLVMLITLPLWNFFSYSIISFLICMVPSVMVDWYYYGKPVVAVWNILTYNVFNPTSGGSELYGVEPWHYYLTNLFLNFNIVFFLALFSLPLFVFSLWKEWRSLQTTNIGELFLMNRLGSIVSVPKFRALIIACSFYLWLLFMMKIPHKEERFMFVIYPQVCITAALAVSTSLNLFNSYSFHIPPFRVLKPFSMKFAVVLIVVVFVLLSVSRIFALIHYYNAPMRLWNDIYHFHEFGNSSHQLYVCLGKEWHRFPSHYFLPSNARLGFIRSSFRGQLPQYYAEINGTRVILPNFNDQNKEETSRYVLLDHCDYFVDFEFDDAKDVKLSSIRSKWQIVKQYPFLNAPASSRLFRAFWVPYFSTLRNRWAP